MLSQRFSPNIEQ